jgi:hypothetical protein
MTRLLSFSFIKIDSSKDTTISLMIICPVILQTLPFRDEA